MEGGVREGRQDPTSGRAAIKPLDEGGSWGRPANLARRCDEITPGWVGRSSIQNWCPALIPKCKGHRNRPIRKRQSLPHPSWFAIWALHLWRCPMMDLLRLSPFPISYLATILPPLDPPRYQALVTSICLTLIAVAGPGQGQHLTGPAFADAVGYLQVVGPGPELSRLQGFCRSTSWSICLSRTETPPPREATPRKQALWKAVHHARLQGVSLRGIATELGISRNTVRKYADSPAPPVFRTPRRST